MKLMTLLKEIERKIEHQELSEQHEKIEQQYQAEKRNSRNFQIAFFSLFGITLAFAVASFIIYQNQKAKDARIKQPYESIILQLEEDAGTKQEELADLRGQLQNEKSGRSELEKRLELLQNRHAGLVNDLDLVNSKRDALEAEKKSLEERLAKAGVIYPSYNLQDEITTEVQRFSEIFCNSGLEKEKDGKISEADDLYLKSLEKDPGNPRANYRLGRMRLFNTNNELCSPLSDGYSQGIYCHPSRMEEIRSGLIAPYLEKAANYGGLTGKQKRKPRFCLGG